MKNIKLIALGFPFMVAFVLLVTTHLGGLAFLVLLGLLWLVVSSWLIGSLVAFLWRNRP